ncbi:preQ(1) synthase [Desulfobacterales bacterium HSG17]|nr:preQ(1) synthase [Desulfobacterales bacterium HSG17]
MAETPYPVNKPDNIKIDVLDPIDYQYRDRRDISIVIEQPEFTSVCPMTGLPDFGTVIIKYKPDVKIVELKSLKYYLLQYRNVGIFYEHVVNRILDDLVDVLQPKQMEITGNFTARGGILTTVIAEYEGRPNKGRPDERKSDERKSDA